MPPLNEDLQLIKQGKIALKLVKAKLEFVQKLLEEGSETGAVDSAQPIKYRLKAEQRRLVCRERKITRRLAWLNDPTKHKKRRQKLRGLKARKGGDGQIRIVDRDLNAAKNMLYLGLQMTREEPRHKAFVCGKK